MMGRMSARPHNKPTARQRVRDQITAEILQAARGQLAESGAGAISLRQA